MDFEKTLEELKHMKVETGSFVCLGCGYEHNCSIHGCAILRDAVECIEELKRVLQESEAAREDLARASSRGLFDFAEIVSGLPSLPEGAVGLEPCFASLGFSRRPESIEEVQSRYRQLAKVMHPDAGGDADAFQLLGENYRKCLELMEGEN